MTKMEIARTTINMVESYFGLSVDVKVIPLHSCQPEDMAYVSNISEGEYEIEVNPNFLKDCEELDLVAVIAHEMVHVKQHELDGLSLETKAHYFKGQWFDPEDDYWFSPWEVEARGYEKAFVNLYAINWEKFV